MLMSKDMRWVKAMSLHHKFFALQTLLNPLITFYTHFNSLVVINIRTYCMLEMKMELTVNATFVCLHCPLYLRLLKTVNLDLQTQMLKTEYTAI